METNLMSYKRLMRTALCVLLWACVAFDAASCHRQSEMYRVLQDMLVDCLVNDSFKSRVNQNVTSAINDYNELKVKQYQTRIKEADKDKWFAIAMLIILACLTTILILYLNKSQKEAIEQKVKLAEDLRALLKRKQEDDDRSAALVRGLLSSKYEYLEKLSDIIIQSQDTKKSKERIGNAMAQIVESLTFDNQQIQELGRQIDAFCDNLYSDFVSDFPDLKEADYKCFIFTVLGISPITMSVLMREKSINCIYERKRRLRNKIKQSASNTEKYLKYI